MENEKLGVLLPINKHDPVAIQARIKELEGINLGNSDLLEIRKSLCNSLNLPDNAWIQIMGYPIYRGQINDNDIPFDSIKRISYNPSPAKTLGRANLIGEQVFYGANDWKIAAIEACQDKLRNEGIKEFYVTIGKWVFVKDFNVSVICHSNIRQGVVKELKEAVEAIDIMMREGRSPEEYQSLLLINKFFANQFAKQNINYNNDYFFSAFCASELLNHSAHSIQGIWYPSVPYLYYGYNYVLKTSFIDEGFIKFEEASFHKLLFKDIDSLPVFEFLKFTSKFENDTIAWS